MKKAYFIIGTIVLVVIVLAVAFLRINDKIIINDFDSCAAAGYPILESYPEQCNTPEGQTFVKEYAFNYSEGLILMQNKDSGEFACFGCGKTMCIDPAPIMETIIENESRYCDADFNVIIDGKLSYFSDGLSPYQNSKTNELGCFGCNNKMCVDILVDENTLILNETENFYCNSDFEIIQPTDLILIKSDFGDKIVYDMSQNIDNLRIDCNARGGTFNECGSICANDAEVCVKMCGFTCENLS